MANFVGATYTDDLAKWFVEEVYPELKESKKIEILINNTDLGVG